MSIISNLSRILLVGNSNNPVNDLRRKPTREDYLRTLNCWVERNFYIICLAAILFLLLIFCILCFLIVGVSATESGAMRNFINGGVL